jgi:hypothetical protein
MPGTNQNRCILDVCVYKCYFDPAWKQAGFLQDGIEIGSSDLSEWGVNPTSQETIEVWDKNRL